MNDSLLIPSHSDAALIFRIPGSYRSQFRFWRIATVLGPIAAAVVPLSSTLALGGFKHFQWVGRDVSGLEAWGILGAMLFPVAAYFFAEINCNEAMARLSQCWPTTIGKVLSREVVERQAQYGRLYRLAVSYTYDVAGRHYHGDTVAFGPNFWTDGDIVPALAQKYKPDAMAEVHNDPANPGVAVLETSEQFASQKISIVRVLLAVPFMAPAILLLRDFLQW